MTMQNVQKQYGWRREKEGLGRWEHRGKVAIAGFAQSVVDRRWDGKSMDKTVGGHTIWACQRAMEDAGVTPDQVDGIICFQDTIAGGYANSLFIRHIYHASDFRNPFAGQDDGLVDFKLLSPPAGKAPGPRIIGAYTAPDFYCRSAPVDFPLLFFHLPEIAGRGLIL